MSEDDAFLAAVAASPGDDAPRLIYADWLDERGDPRGEFIQLMAEMDALPVSSDGFAARRPRREELRAGLAPAGLDAMGYARRHRPLFTELPPTRRERWRLVEEFISVCHKPPPPRPAGSWDDRFAEAEKRHRFRIPPALREWYELFGWRKDVWSVQDHLLAPEEYRIDAPTGTLIFRVENQGCEYWGIRPDDQASDDPPVFELGSGRTIAPTISAFACQMLLYEVKFAAGLISATNQGSPVDPGRLIELLHRCDAGGPYWVMVPLHLFEGADLIVEVQPEDWAYVTARSETAFARFLEATGWEVERYD